MKKKLKFSRRTARKGGYSKREFPVSEFIPYAYHYDNETIITKNNEIIQFIKVEGFSFETADDEDVDMKKMIRNSLLKSLADGSFAMWCAGARAVFPGENSPKVLPVS